MVPYAMPESGPGAVPFDPIAFSHGLVGLAIVLLVAIALVDLALSR